MFDVKGKVRVVLLVMIICSFVVFTKADPGDPCNEFEFEDCLGNCYNTTLYEPWVGDGYCDRDDTGSYPNFMCSEFELDGDDCNDFICSNTFICTDYSYSQESCESLEIAVGNDPCYWVTADAPGEETEELGCWCPEDVTS